MENASKALLMAAGILISMLIISLAVYLFANFATVSRNTDKKIEENQLLQFNNQFTKYADTEGGITIYDVVTIANLAKENNQNYNLTKDDAGENSFYIKVDFTNELNYQNLQEKNQEDYNNLIKTRSGTYNNGNGKFELTFYNCTVDISPTTGRVYKVTIK